MAGSHPKPPSDLPPDRRAIVLAPGDNVAAAAVALHAQEEVVVDGRALTMREDVPTGHKLAISAIEPGEKVMKHGAPIGSATRRIEPGEHVHTHNLKSDYLPTFTAETHNRERA